MWGNQVDGEGAEEDEGSKWRRGEGVLVEMVGGGGR